MKRYARSLPRNPFLAWSDLAWELGEMSLASAQVIAYRTTRMAAAGPLPGARDRKEFTRMGREKFEAATESGAAIVTHVAAMNLKFGARAFGHMLTGTTAFMSLAGSRSVGQFITRQAKVVESLARSAQAATELSDSAARVARRGLEPIHTRATANAKRLRKG